MKPILTAEEFLTLMLAQIKLRGAELSEVLLPVADLDLKFENAYQALVSEGAQSQVTPNFSFRRHRIYGNSVKFRDALLAVRERRLIEPDPSKAAFKVALPVELARELVDHGAIEERLLNHLAEAFVPAAAPQQS